MFALGHIINSDTQVCVSSHLLHTVILVPFIQEAHSLLQTAVQKARKQHSERKKSAKGTRVLV